VAIATDAAAARVVRVLVMTQFRPEAILLQNQISYRNVHVVCISKDDPTGVEIHQHWVSFCRQVSCRPKKLIALKLEFFNPARR
jgi:hypothetical protein